MYAKLKTHTHTHLTMHTAQGPFFPLELFGIWHIPNTVIKQVSLAAGRVSEHGRNRSSDTSVSQKKEQDFGHVVGLNLNDLDTT